MNNIEHLYDTVNPGTKFGKLTVVEEDVNAKMRSKTNHKFFKCKCDCGSYTSVDVYNLIKGTTKSCGCYRKGRPRNKLFKDLTGYEFGNLVVISRDENKPIGSGKHVYWNCSCTSCGNIKSIRGSDLTSGRCIDCGCGKSKRLSAAKAQDLSNKTFGHLKVLEKDETKIMSGTHAFWICKCDICGRTESVSSTMLLHYGKDRCKICMGVSNGEKKIIELLEANEIPFIHDKPYNGFKYSKSKGTARFDFRIVQNSNCDYIIEFDGEQHFKDVSFGPGKSQGLQYWKVRDEEKNNFCNSNNIPLIRIPYNKLPSLEINDLLPDKTEYLVN